MVDACRRDLGFTMVVTSPDGGYRDLAMQQALIYDPQGPVPIASLGKSSHGWGTAVDIWSRDMNWMNANAPRFGFTQTWANEPWHWQWDGTPAGGEYEGEKEPPTPTLTQEEIDEMAATKSASIVRDYVKENAGVVAIALIYPDGKAVKLSGSMDVDAAIVAHVQVYGIAATNENNSLLRERYPAQLTTAQWNAFWSVYPGTKIGF
jgi:hypothetical protein